MLVLFFHHYCGVRWTRCHFKCTTFPPNPAEVKTRQVWAQEKKLNKLLGCSSSPRLCLAWQPEELELGTWHATWLPEILHCKLPLLWPAWRAAPWQGVVWCFLKPGLFLEDKKKKKKQQSAGICAVLPLQCIAWCLWWLGNRCLKNNVKKKVVTQLDKFLVHVCVMLECPHGQKEVFGDGAVGFCQVCEIHWRCGGHPEHKRWPWKRAAGD